jgi:hypothetical protein
MLGAGGSADGGVTGEIVFAEVRLGLNDDAAGDAIFRLALENGAEHIARDQLRFSIIELARQNFAAVKLRPRPRAE